MDHNEKRRASRQEDRAATTNSIHFTSSHSVEQWSAVPGYEGAYEVSDQGHVRSVDRRIVDSRGVRRTLQGRLLTPQVNAGGYLSVHLSRGGRGAHPPVHRLVLAAFVGPAPEGYETRHLDGDPANNALPNLTWGTHSENELDKFDHHTHPAQQSIHCPRGHTLRYGNLEPSHFRNRRRTCRACNAAKAWARYRGLTFGDPTVLDYARARYEDYIADPVAYIQWKLLVDLA
ncbi:NUMOD4 motif-containing HNH endonuclease [Corynebacterium suedekumii]|uniref:NUMOD4 motif-containing HNH endonuclease n=1 Tax=Corynebacterium suedekumii TaxID=3049801 RepID=UPI003D7AC5E7